jgi:high-affinity iron transporter
MDTGAFFTTFIMIFRESLEASLIIGIILTVLAKLNQHKYFPHVYASILVALFVSVAAGLFLTRITASSEGNVRALLEGLISLLACLVLTYMVFWMDSQARHIKPQVQSQFETAISKKEYFVMMSLPFLAIFREGAETVLFLCAMISRDANAVSFGGAVAGLLLAVFIALIIFVGGKKIALKSMFQSTGIFLLFIAAGLLAYGIHEFNEIGLIPEIYAPVWNINHILNEKSGLGAFLKAILGYNGNPSLSEVLSYIIYLAGVCWLLQKRKKEAVI